MTATIKLLGSLLIEDIHGAPSIIMKSPKGCALVTYLIVTNQMHSRETIADLLWEATSTSQALQNLRQLLRRVRQWVPELHISRKHISLLNLQTDYQTLLGALAAEDDLDQLDHGLRLYQGDLLDGFHLSDAPRFNEWLTLKRETIRHQVVGAYRKLCVAYSGTEEWVKGVDAARRWLDLDDLDEEACRFLLQFLVADNQIEMALQQYELVRKRLWDELAVEPAAETLDLIEQIVSLKEERAGWDVRDVVDSPNRLAELGELPTQAYVPYQRNDDFTGREEILVQLADVLLPQVGNREWRTAAVTGLGGMGKTQTAVEFCYRYGRFFEGGVYWLNFADKENVAAEISLVGGERGMGLYDDGTNIQQTDRIGRVVEAWAELTPRLLIFDNCEDEALLAQWLPTQGGCSVLLTSRRVNWAKELTVKELPLPILSRTESIHFLHLLAPDITDDEAAEIGTELGHLPLALQLAGSFLRRYKQIPVSQYLLQLRDRNLLEHPSLQGRTANYSPTGHELSVARTFAVSWEQLDAANEIDWFAQKLLVCIACFAPGEPIPNDLLLSTLNNRLDREVDLMTELLAVDGLMRLTELGFVQPKGRETVVMHRLVVHFVGQVLVDDEAYSAVEQAILERVDTHLESEGWLYSLPIAYTHLRFVADVSLERQDLISARLAFLLGTHLSDVSAYDAAASYLKKALSIYQQLLDPNHVDTASCLHILSILNIRIGNYREARMLIEQILTIREQTLGVYHQKTASTLNNLGFLLRKQGDYERAIHYIGRALEIYQHVFQEDHASMATSFNNLGSIYTDIGEYELAASHLQRAFEIRQHMLDGKHPSLATTIHGLGKLQLKLGHLQAAKRILSEAFTLREEILGSTHPYVALTLRDLGELALLQAEYDKAEDLLERALAIQEDSLVKDHMDKVPTLRNLGDLQVVYGSDEQARRYYERALTILERHTVELHPMRMEIAQNLQVLKSTSV